MLFGVFQFGTGAGAGYEIVGLLGDRARDLGAQAFGAGLGFVAGEAFQGAGEDDGLAGDRGVGLGPFGVENLGQFGLERGDDLQIVRLVEEVGQG